MRFGFLKIATLLAISSVLLTGVITLLRPDMKMAMLVLWYHRIDPLITRFIPRSRPIPLSSAAHVMTTPWPKGATPFRKPVLPHFNEWATPFVITIAPVATRSAPSNGQDAHVITQLKRGVRVRVVYEHPAQWGTGDQGAGKWVFVLNEKGTAALGWVVASSLAFPHQFVPVSRLPWSHIGLCVGDYCGEFTIKPTGRFVERWDAIGQGVSLRGLNTGQVLQYRTVLWFKQDEPSDFDEWVIWDGRTLTPEPKYQSEPFRVGPNPGRRLRSPAPITLSI